MASHTGDRETRRGGTEGGRERMTDRMSRGRDGGGQRTDKNDDRNRTGKRRK